MSPDDIVVIRKRGYFYGPQWCGYTGEFAKAGRYRRDDAEKHAASVQGVSVHELAEFAPAWSLLAKLTSAQRLALQCCLTLYLYGAVSFQLLYILSVNPQHETRPFVFAVIGMLFVGAISTACWLARAIVLQVESGEAKDQ